eukprot:6368094-Amphidinium_carterae.1
MELPTGLVPGTLKNEIQSLIEQSKLGERVACWELIQKALLKNGLARAKVQMAPELVGVHPMNRSRIGLQPSLVHQHGFQILEVG